MINGIKKGAICFLSANQSLTEISNAIRIVSNEGTTITSALGREILTEIKKEKLTTSEEVETFSIVREFVTKSRVVDIAHTFHKSLDEIYGSFSKSMSILSIHKLLLHK